MFAWLVIPQHSSREENPLRPTGTKFMDSTEISSAISMEIATMASVESLEQPIKTNKSYVKKLQCRFLEANICIFFFLHLYGLDLSKNPVISMVLVPTIWMKDKVLTLPTLADRAITITASRIYPRRSWQPGRLTVANSHPIWAPSIQSTHVPFPSRHALSCHENRKTKWLQFPKVLECGNTSTKVADH